MASELQTDYITGKVVYFLLRNSIGRAWNGSAFEVYATANYANYVILATEQGTASAYFAASMPAAAAGVYYLIAKERVGGSAAETDITIATGIMQWDGTAALALSSVPTTTFQTNIADTVLSRGVSNVEGTANIHSLCSAILKLVSKFSVKDAANANNATVYRTDGTTIHMTQVPVTDSTLTATRSLGVGA